MTKSQLPSRLAGAAMIGVLGLGAAASAGASSRHTKPATPAEKRARPAKARKGDRPLRDARSKRPLPQRHERIVARHKAAFLHKERLDARRRAFLVHRALADAGWRHPAQHKAAVRDNKAHPRVGGATVRHVSGRTIIHQEAGSPLGGAMYSAYDAASAAVAADLQALDVHRSHSSASTGARATVGPVVTIPPSEGAPVGSGPPRAASAPSGAPGAPALPAVPSGFSASQLVFQDGFTGSVLNSSKWNTFVTSKAAGGWPWNNGPNGGSGVANASNQFDAEYDVPSQVSVSNGLSLQASAQPINGILGGSTATYPWRSGVVSSYNKFQFTGGYLQVTAKMPVGDGMWPGLWLLPGPGGTGGDNFEIDLFEGGYTGSGPASQAFAWHLHTPAGTMGGTAGTGVDLGSGYHTYGLDWVPGQSISWYLDGRLIGRLTSAQLPIPTEPMELIMDLQVANQATAGWHTVPGSSTPAQNVMSIQNIEVYQ